MNKSSDFPCGDVANIKFDIQSQNIRRDLVGDYQNDPEFKQRFQGKVNQLWEAKAATLEKLKK